MACVADVWSCEKLELKSQIPVYRGKLNAWLRRVDKLEDDPIEIAKKVVTAMDLSV